MVSLSSMTMMWIVALLLFFGPGYLVWLRIDKRRVRLSNSLCENLPGVDVIVPLKDERSFVEEKLHNLKSLEYPKDRVRFWLVDGASSDGSTKYLRNFVQQNHQFNLLEFPRSDKTMQLNYALSFCKEPWILVTDADALLPSLILQEMVRIGEERPNTAVVGALVKPHQAMKVEQLHWKFSNWLRVQESRIGLASFVTAPCYLFQRTLLKSFPEDTISDDIHAALLALRFGHEVVVVPPFVTELRSPATLSQLLFHKWRKSRAYFREILRFLPQVFEMCSQSRQAFLWRVTQMILLPLLTLIAGINFLFNFGPFPLLLTFLVVGSIVSLKNKSIWPFLNCFALAVLWLLVLPLSLFTLPFARQTACFPRIGGFELKQNEEP
jgi:cellulose synthase/poly-beta-1,6-N-acetylglucosamine synthase-like glycosyltransferase